DRPTDRRVLTFRTHEDVLAAVPVLLGFEPSDSVVMLTFGGRETFHARIDLPPPEELDEAVRLLLEPAVAHGVEHVLFVVYSTVPQLAEQALDRLGVAFGAAGLRVVNGLHADGTRWFLPGSPGVPYDVRAHPFRVRSVVDGQVVSASREELAARLAPIAGVAEVDEARDRVPGYDATEVVATIWRALPRGRFECDDLAGVLQGMRDRVVRDVAWRSMTRDEAPAHVALWTDAVQRSPDDLVGAPAAVLGLAAWLAGHGALAWCAVDRSVGSDPDNSLAELVGDLLNRAVPPSAWERGAYPDRGGPG
ncbi:DUF4192 domain-containing protein, partial [Nocardioides sp.]|uniref:DUF4192 domain-containing protein n=1 Tax=Nocardioides sp. TaxID=35761 RepID=UPI001A24C946